MLENKNIYPDRLDNAQVQVENELLFSGYDDFSLLVNPIFSTNSDSPNSGQWSKEEQNIYYYWVDKKTNIEFIYNNIDGKFSCDYTDKLCKKIYR